MPSQSHKRPSQTQSASRESAANVGNSAQGRFGNAWIAEQLSRRNAPESASAEAAAPTPETANRGLAESTGGDTAWTTATPLKVAHPLPAQPGEQRRVVAGVEIVGRDVSPSALDACERFVTATIGNRPDIQERMEDERVALVIVPRGRPMTDVAEFGELRGQNTFDGRPWAAVRGSGGRKTRSGLWAIAVPEENLVATGGTEDQYPDGYSVGLHEFAHTLQSKGVSRAERREIGALYAARKAAGGPWTDNYAASNDQEYFAQLTNTYFGQNARVGHNGADWLRDNDPAAFQFLVRLYGPLPAPPAAPAQA